MTWKLSCASLLCAAFLCVASQGQKSVTRKPSLDFHAYANDSYADGIRKDAEVSITEIELFFGAPFPDPIHFQLVNDRVDFDAAVKKFGLSPTQCWMVGMGTADLMVVLSPEDWKK